MAAQRRVCQCQRPSSHLKTVSGDYDENIDSVMSNNQQLLLKKMLKDCAAFRAVLEQFRHTNGIP